MRSFEEEQLLLDGVTDDTQSKMTPSGDTSHGFAKESTPGEGVREFYRQQGQKRYVDLLAAELTAQQCFDHIKNSSCGHPSCFTVATILSKIKGENK